MAWVLQCKGVVNTVHYLGDFLFWSPPGSPLCEVALGKATALCDRLGLPTAPHKTVGPVTSLTFLGIEIDSVVMVLRLPADKLACLRRMLFQWEKRRHVTKHDLLVLIGHLNHASAVVRPGCSFVRQLINASKIPRHQTHRVRLNAGCRADVAWWSTFVQQWNGVSLFLDLASGPSAILDASGLWGCGAYTITSHQWFHCSGHRHGPRSTSPSRSLSP